VQERDSANICMYDETQIRIRYFSMGRPRLLLFSVCPCACLLLRAPKVSFGRFYLEEYSSLLSHNTALPMTHEIIRK